MVWSAFAAKADGDGPPRVAWDRGGWRMPSARELALSPGPQATNGEARPRQRWI